MDGPRKRRRGFFDGFDDDFLDEFEEEFKRMHETFGQFFEDMTSHRQGDGMRRYVYGFSVHTGPDGKPVLEEFGNVPKRGAQEIPGEREPLVDIIDGTEDVTVIAELPGVEKGDIDLEADGRSLAISVDTEGRRYRKELELPSEVDPQAVKASYKNGVLEVKLRRKGAKNAAKKRIIVE